MAMAQPFSKPIADRVPLTVARDRDEAAPRSQSKRGDDRTRWSGPRSLLFVLIGSAVLWGVVIAAAVGISDLIG